MAFDLMIQGGRLVIPKQGVIAGDIGIKDRKIAAILEPDSGVAAREKIDAAGLHVFPGVIEPHSHIGIGAGVKDLGTETHAAALGGVCTNLFLRHPDPYDRLYQELKDGGESIAYTDFSFHIVLLTDQHLSSIGKYIREWGITSFKFYMTYRGEDARMLGYDGTYREVKGIDDGFMLDCFREVAKYPEALIICHAENIEIIRRERDKLIAAGRDDMEAWQSSRPLIAEVDAARRALLFAETTGCRLNLLHISAGATLEAAKDTRRRYDRIHVEVCHPYLTCHEEGGLDNAQKFKPPLRKKSDADALWEGLRDGNINSVGSDHVPRKVQAKMGTVWTQITGGPGTPVLLPVLLGEGYQKRKIPLERIAELTSYNPAKIYGLYPRKGDIRVGTDADLTLVDLNKVKTIQAKDFAMYGDHFPCDGLEVKGWPVMTIIRGQTVMKDGKIVAEAGWGKYVGR
jgi:dihydropyrimidinase